jgi:hypothetical protein
MKIINVAIALYVVGCAIVWYFVDGRAPGL